MQALVIGGSDGFCFIEKDASLNSRAGSKAPRKGSPLNPSLLIKQLAPCQCRGSFLPLLILSSHCFCKGIVWGVVRNDVPSTRSNAFLSSSVSKHLLLVCSSPASFLSDTRKADVSRGLKMLKV